MGIRSARCQARGMERERKIRRIRRGEREIHLMRNGSGGGRAAEGAGFKIGVRSEVMMQMMRRHAGRGVGTQLQPVRRAAGRHEAHRNIGAQQEHGQQKDASR